MMVPHFLLIVSKFILERERMHADDVIVNEPLPAKKQKDTSESGQTEPDKTFESYSVVYVPLNADANNK